MELDKRFFSENNIRTTLRKLNMGIDNAYLTRLTKDGILPEPDINEFTVKLWGYYKVIKLVQTVYKLKSKEDMFNIDQANLVLNNIKGGKDKLPL